MSNENMNILDHLEELRKRIIITLSAFLVFFVVAFIFVRDIYSWFVKDLDGNLTVLGPLDIIWVFFAIAGVIALTLTVPLLIFQIWLFVKPALTPKERKTTLLYIPGSFFLFIAGLCFGYFIVLPLVMNFLLGLGEGLFQTMFTPDRYFQFVIRMTLPFSILFELPLVVMFLTSLGLISPVGMRKNRKYAYFVIVVISVLISPPDFLSDVLMIIPLVFLYEISISLCSVVYKRKQKREEKG
ncbi:twin-arginine translocase subunit TatC [Evansella cellulosilytica]|uniref:Sec-independent protein translocase protein TatC n=1 Tax=Evansella cellulosilytica (strain ATCC 21833 / DSM 2522 / FERM P-1141 / JCM 9156 / N-4) TaxID=649639 RepID=E6U083_EVAC2|nr:twin-arginine translocase subunit TatC [Evansella cellulosilytica]ADU30199.1 Sec-independent protein translocase, TatC subunit [Evansella cellulosilytica DSM 2522]